MRNFIAKMFFENEGMIEINSVDLQNLKTYTDLIDKGYVWIRRKPIKNFNLQLREPTIGFTVEVYNYKENYCIELTSKKGKKMVSRLGFYSNM
jgi:hypothetical protein